MTAVRVMTLPHHDTRSRPLEVLPPVELTTDRLLFRPLASADRSRVLTALEASRDALLPTIPLNQTDALGAEEPDRDLFDRWVANAIESDNNRTAWRRAAFLEDGTFVGLFNLIKIDLGLEWTCEANWWVDRRLAGRGFATEGVEALLHFATADLPVGLGLHRVTAMIQPDNAASIRVAEKCGMRSTGHAELLEINGSARPHLEFVHPV